MVETSVRKRKARSQSLRDMPPQDAQHANQEATTTPLSRRGEHAPVLITDAESPPQTVLARADPAPPDCRLPTYAPMRVLGLQALRDAPWKEIVLPLPTVRRDLSEMSRRKVFSFAVQGACNPHAHQGTQEAQFLTLLLLPRLLLWTPCNRKRDETIADACPHSGARLTQAERGESTQLIRKPRHAAEANIEKAPLGEEPDDGDSASEHEEGDETQQVPRRPCGARGHQRTSREKASRRPAKVCTRQIEIQITLGPWPRAFRQFARVCPAFFGNRPGEERACTLSSALSAMPQHKADCSRQPMTSWHTHSPPQLGQDCVVR